MTMNDVYTSAMEGSDEGLSQAIFNGSSGGSTDDRPEIGYGGCDFVQKLLAKAQFRDESTILQSPTPAKPTAGRVALRRNRRTSKEVELALLALRMPLQDRRQPQVVKMASPGPVTRSRSCHGSPMVAGATSPANGLASRSGTRSSSPNSSLNDSTESLFATIPPTPPMAKHGSRSNSATTTIVAKSNNLRANLRDPVVKADGLTSYDEKSGVTFEERGKPPPRTPQNQRAFSQRLAISKSSTPVSTPTLASRGKQRTFPHGRLPFKSPMMSPAAARMSDKARHCAATGKNSPLTASLALGLDTSIGDNESSQEIGREALTIVKTCPDRKGGGGDSLDEDDEGDSMDELLIQATQQAEMTYALKNKPPTSVSRGRPPRVYPSAVAADVVTSRSVSTRSTPKRVEEAARPTSTATPRKRRSKEGDICAPAVVEGASTARANRVGAHQSTINRPSQPSSGEPLVVTRRSAIVSTAVTNSQNAVGDSKRTYSEEEIRRKREAALRKRQQKQNSK